MIRFQPVKKNSRSILAAGLALLCAVVAAYVREENAKSRAVSEYKAGPPNSEKAAADLYQNPVSKSPIEEVAIGLLKAHPNLKFAVEDLEILNNVIPAQPDAPVHETEAQAINRVSALIAKHTDYETRLYKHWLIVVPRANKERYDTPSALRVCSAPAAIGVPVDDFIQKVKGARPEEPLTLFTKVGFYIPGEPTGPIDSGERTVPVFELLSDIAEQLSARCWRIDHMLFSNSDPGKKYFFPLKLQVGALRFHAPGEIASAINDGR